VLLRARQNILTLECIPGLIIPIVQNRGSEVLYSVVSRIIGHESRVLPAGASGLNPGLPPEEASSVLFRLTQVAVVWRRRPRHCQPVRQIRFAQFSGQAKNDIADA